MDGEGVDGAAGDDGEVKVKGFLQHSGGEEEG